MLSVWGLSTDDFFVVGGALGNGTRPAVAWRRKGGALVDLAPGGDDSLWWSHGTSMDDVWMVGEKGRMVRVVAGAPADQPRVTDATLWGVFAVSATEAWAVGGTPGTGPSDVVLRWDGAAWAKETLPGTPRGAALFKVWASGPGEVFVVGEGATIWRRSAGAWTLDPAPKGTGSLRTVHGCDATHVYAVGGKDVLLWNGSVWSRVEVEIPGAVNGVHCGKAGVMLVGSGGTKILLRDGQTKDFSLDPPYSDLHAVMCDDAGTCFGAGGDFVSPATPGKSRPGVLARYGVGAVTLAAP